MDKRASTWRSAWDIFRKLILRGCVHPKKIFLLYKVWPYTMVGAKRLLNAYDLTSRVIQEKIPGDIVECGVFKGGCAALMAYRSKELENKRTIWLYDSFEGLPEPSKEDGKKVVDSFSKGKLGQLTPTGKCVGPIEEVEAIFSKLKIEQNKVLIVKGWFQETLPIKANQPDLISILRLDGDWYESTRVCLEYLYDKVVPGGYIILDDYFAWEGCKRAVLEFLRQRNVEVAMHPIDGVGVYFVKPGVSL